MTTNLRDQIRYIFLDRDGVINRKMPEGLFVTRPVDLVLCDGAGEAIFTLNQMGVKVLVVTNQRGVALGLYSEEDLHSIHFHLQALLAAQGAHIDGIYFCPHERDCCDCRKPKPGMILRAFKEFPQATPANSLLIGDSLSDIKAGGAVGMKTVFVAGDAGTQQTGAEAARALATFTAASLAEFVRLHVS